MNDALIALNFTAPPDHRARVSDAAPSPGCNRRMQPPWGPHTLHARNACGALSPVLTHESGTALEPYDTRTRHTSLDSAEQSPRSQPDSRATHAPLDAPRRHACDRTAQVTTTRCLPAPTKGRPPSAAAPHGTPAGAATVPTDGTNGCLHRLGSTIHSKQLTA